MLAPEPLPKELKRLAALFRYDILDTPEESEFNELAQMAAELCNVKIALISLIDQERQWFKASVGLDVKETPRDISFCGHAIHNDQIFEIPDAKQDDRFADNPLVTADPHIRFYAGKPLQAFDGSKLGTLCIIDPEPRVLTDRERRILSFLGRQVEKQLALRLHLRQSKQSLQLIQAQAQRLEEKTKIQNQLISVLAHDLRSPIASLEGLVDAFDQEFLSQDQTVALIRELRPELTHTSNQLNQVLQWVQQQLNADAAELQPFSIGAIAQDSLYWVKQRATEKQIILAQDIEENLYALGQPELVHIIWRNLLSNAIKYSSPKDTVTLFAHRDQQEIILGVKDQGLGMTPQILESLRNHQRQAPKLGTANEQGTGLGLILCQTYLQKMNSQLDIKSEVSIGSTFSFRLAADPDNGNRDLQQ
ncbi:GAF domain-containing sensor histidine kinase [[Limnothrix rosea] IAM M-220]|uniref:GAF domain-containing sensor histidine kinase n=1 Tax=[Limnothrix rosea] IAM M-220 TaxID=454133 RepID=UPI000968E370|nr:GAF domain-containing sensor histidine kinase [[Limnothrix rosea] IAM M-220]OKH19612.1 hypothetical protein NIES208_02070 [[Limnothrix rosea] IAM M-220]